MRELRLFFPWLLFASVGCSDAALPSQGPGRDGGGDGFVTGGAAPSTAARDSAVEPDAEGEDTPADASADAAGAGGATTGASGQAPPDATVDAATADDAAPPFPGDSSTQHDGQAPDPCDRADLSWKTGKKTNYVSYPEPGSEECIEYSGCQWAGWFAGCEEQQSEDWVAAHNIAALFPGFDDYALHDICIRSGAHTLVVTVYDTCGDSDCGGCCTRNQGEADALIDLEHYTNERWGLPDGEIEWADLGPSPSPACD